MNAMKVRNLVIFLGTLFSANALAGPADYVYTPIVEHGEKEIDFKFGTAENPAGTTKEVASLGYGYGATEYWFTEIYLKTESVDSEPRLNILEWENKFQLTESGKYPLEVGLITEFEFPLNNEEEPNEFKIGPLFQTDIDKVQLNANLLLESTFNGPVETEHEIVSQYQWQGKYRWKKEFEFGVQGFGELGEWNDWLPQDEQEHKIGPAAFGVIGVGDRKIIKYNFAWLSGMTDATPDDTFRLQAEFEF